MNSHQQNFTESLEAALVEKMNDFEESKAFVRIAASWLNYESLSEENFVDGGKDLGLDFWQKSESGFEIFQVKSHELNNNKLNPSKFDNEGVKDLGRFLNYLLNDDPAIGGSKKLANFRHQWDDAITRILMSKSEKKKPLKVISALVVFGDGITDGAKKEFDLLVAKYKEPVRYRKVEIEVSFKLITLDELFEEKWRQHNREWRDKTGQKRNFIHLTPEVPKSKDQENIISSGDSAVFYAKAIDLVTAFEDFGYQIFEPNVRANISKSKINAEIRNTLSRRKSRKEFKFLNNGVTLTCTSFKKPKENAPYFAVNEPGIVNGLQTVSALHEAYYHELDGNAKEEFEDDCYVLVRLITEKAVTNINDVVIATNSQNPMQPRNLKSNSNEQILYEKLFAEAGWFFERKQGAWEAFSSDPERWRTLSNYNKSNFQIQKKSKYRVIDNHDLGQTWLAFIGFSNEAVNDRRYIFERDQMYDLTFLHKTSTHGSDFNFEMDQSRDYLISGSPSPSLMLVSYLVNRFAKATSLSFNETREEAYKRLKLDPQKMGREQLDAELAKDDRYMLESVLGGMAFIFTEFFGYVMYKALGERVHNEGNNILNAGALKKLSQDYDAYLPELIRTTRQEEIHQDDLLPIVWFVFRECMEQMLASQWKLGFQTARSRSRFNHSKDTRIALYNQLESINRYMEKTQILKVWAADIPPKKGLYHYVRDIVLSSR